MKGSSQNETQSKLQRFLRVRVFLTLALALLLPLAFQNCSQVEFAQVEQASKSDVVCDPFSAGADCGTGSGLIGNIYSLPGGVGVQNYINYGTKLDVMIQLTNLDIPERDWTAGFPGPKGLLKDTKGEDLVEYFALDLRGYITAPQNFPEGDYQFATASDDGTIIDIGGRTVIDNDGDHGLRWECADQPVSLKAGRALPIRVRYYQGPRRHIALQVLLRPWSKRSSDCGRGGRFEVLPSAMLSH